MQRPAPTPDDADERERSIAALLSRLAEAIEPQRHGAQITAAVFDRIEEFTAHADDEDLRRLTNDVAVDTLHDVWQHMRHNTIGGQMVPPPAALAWPSELIHRGIELHAMLRAYRVGHDLVEGAWRSTITALGSDDDGAHAEALLRASRFFFAYVDAVSVQLTTIYLEEQTRHARGAAVAREEMIRILLGGAQVPPDRASTALGYRVGGHHVAFIVWMEPGEPAQGHAVTLESVAGRFGAALGGGEYMLVPVGNWVVWGWARSVTPPRRAARPALALPDGVRVAIGDGAADLAGVIRSHREAAEARRVARLAGYQGLPAVFHTDVALIALLTADPAAAARFVDAELGRLGEHDEASTRLRDTLRAYLEENLSPVRTARRLDVNKNTVVYRMEKAEEILGRPVLERRRELEAALLLADLQIAPDAAGPAAQ